MVLPREHGAYGQLGFPLATGLALGRPAAAAGLIALAAVLVFLAHEPAAVLLGQRGARLLRAEGRRARRALALLGVAAALAGLAGLALAPPQARAAVLLPATLGALCAAAMLAARERTTAGEVTVALALASAEVPVALAGGAGGSVALSLAAAWALCGATHTVAVRGLIARSRGGASPRLAWMAPAGASIGAVALGVLAATGRAPGAAAAAVGLSACVALVLALRPPPPRRLRTVGWTLMATSVAIVALLVGGAR